MKFLVYAFTEIFYPSLSYSQSFFHNKEKLEAVCEILWYHRPISILHRPHCTLYNFFFLNFTRLA